jgi:RimJ/RimL family protein N-acetyltransferase
VTAGALLRDVTEADLPILFAQQSDPAAAHMAAFTARDRDAFWAHWTRILEDDSITKRVILSEGQVAGHIGCFDRSGMREVGYWVGREYWGRGLATAALSQLLREEQARPLYARVAADNVASIRVLEKCGFAISGYERTFADARGEEIDEALLELR